ncbi:toll/interleukin-1 receptor domain-containing protein [Lentzea sp. HUAS12]|uniref:toll/interleukin-1 receptor domain-containing protein n=1 Tax=Lentzea sp. HUAS12 TaxID=2951806 RepID=UPI00209D1CD1|nr:toll/interleukin-1 receptor domain-containing protein [Lentzea sp. HUAS12]USX53015.1 toll/interleukin-1 receptor domain-containing protein [Lentzea sp. HUAS12]
MRRIFLSYRINDSVHATAAIAGLLAQHYGAGNVFRDRDSLPLGSVYPRRIRRELERADVVLAVIGPSWLTIRNKNDERCLDDERDWVRTELRMAFERDIPVVPVLLDGTPLPDRSQLPADIALISLSMYWQVRHRTFESDVRGLIANLEGGDQAAPAGGAGGQRVMTNTASHGGTVISNQGDGPMNVTQHGGGGG